MAGRSDHARRQGGKAANRRAAVAKKRKAELFAGSLAGRVAVAAGCPVERCVRHEALFETGLGTVAIGRRLPSGLVATGIFLVDVWCLGVKDVVFEDFTPSELDDRMRDLGKAGRFVDITPACARKLLAGAAAVAAASTFQPPKAYAVVQGLFGKAAADCEADFVFGKNGIPTYRDGAGQSFARDREIVATLERVHGTDGWDVLTDTSVASPLGRFKAVIDAYRDHPALRALKAEVDAYDSAQRQHVENDLPTLEDGSGDNLPPDAGAALKPSG